MERSVRFYNLNRGHHQSCNTDVKVIMYSGPKLNVMSFM